MAAASPWSRWWHLRIVASARMPVIGHSGLAGFINLGPEWQRYRE